MVFSVLPCGCLRRTNSPSFENDEEVYKWVQGVLNRVTPEKFETLVHQVIFIPSIQSEQVKASIVDLIYDKASEEEMYSQLYAELCHCLTHAEFIRHFANASIAMVRLQEEELSIEGDSLPTIEYSSRLLPFRKLLIQKCCDLFELYIRALATPLTVVSADNYKKMRVKAVGFMKFAAELYISEVLDSQTIANMLVRLYNGCRLYNIECFVKIISTAGRYLEKEAAADSPLYDVWLDGWCWMGRLAYCPDLCPDTRLRFIVQELVQLSYNAWTPRRLVVENKPTTFMKIARSLQEKTPQEVEAENRRQTLLSIIEEQLYQLLETRQTPTDIPQWIESNFTFTQKNRENLVYGLTRAIARSSMNSSLRIQPDAAKIMLLKEIIGSDLNLQAVAFESIQDLIIVTFGRPLGVLYPALYWLYDNEIVTYEGVMRWKESPSRSTNVPIPLTGWLVTLSSFVAQLGEQTTRDILV